MDENKKQVILPMEEYERLVAAQPEKIVEVRTEYVSGNSEAIGTAIAACILCGLSVAGLFWGWGWWVLIPAIATVSVIGAGADA